MLKNLPDKILNNILFLFNLSLTLGKFPKKWKIANVSMIAKKGGESNDPGNYRPISVTSCLGKILERIVTNRLDHFLLDNSIIIKEQSGFRKNRRTADNLMFLTQKVSESFVLKKKCMQCLPRHFQSI